MTDGKLFSASSPLVGAAEALIDLAQSREFLEPPHRGEQIRWHDRIGDSLDDIVKGLGEHSLGERRRASFHHSFLLAQEAFDSETVEPLKRSVRALADGLFYLSLGSELSEQSKSAALAAALECCKYVRHSGRAKFKARAARLGSPLSGEALDVVIGISWNEFITKLRLVPAVMSDAENSIPASP